MSSSKCFIGTQLIFKYSIIEVRITLLKYLGTLFSGGQSC